MLGREDRFDGNGLSKVDYPLAPLKGKSKGGAEAEVVASQLDAVKNAVRRWGTCQLDEFGASAGRGSTQEQEAGGIIGWLGRSITMAQISMAAMPALKDTFNQLKARMDKAVEAFRKELASQRTGRANVHMLDSIHVDAYGSQVPLTQVGNISAPEPQLITITPWDSSLTGAIEKAIRSSDLGFNPQNDGKLIRIPVPALTEERRKDMVKHLNKVLEEHKTAIRNIRRDGNEAIKKAMKDKKISEDEERGSLDQMQKVTDDEIKKMDEMFKVKEKEVMQV